MTEIINTKPGKEQHKHPRPPFDDLLFKSDISPRVFSFKFSNFNARCNVLKIEKHNLFEITMMLSTDAATVQAAKVHSFGS